MNTEDLLSLLKIYHGSQPKRLFQEKHLIQLTEDGWIYKNNANIWRTTELFQTWIEDLMIIGKDYKTILIRNNKR